MFLLRLAILVMNTAMLFRSYRRVFLVFIIGCGGRGVSIGFYDGISARSYVGNNDTVHSYNFGSVSGNMY